VTDHAPVPVEVGARIFEPFFQVDGQFLRSRRVGLGVSVSGQLAEFQGGSLVLEDPVPGVGASFPLRLPRTGSPLA
jgi:signal transduction histidine kinase